MKPHDVFEESDELAKIWINGNKDHVTQTIFESPKGPALAAAVCMALIEWNQDAVAFCDRLAIHAYTANA